MTAPSRSESGRAYVVEGVLAHVGINPLVYVRMRRKLETNKSSQKLAWLSR